MKITNNQTCLKYLYRERKQFQQHQYKGVALTKAFVQFCKPLVNATQNGSYSFHNYLDYFPFVVGADMAQTLANSLASEFDKQAYIACTKPQLITANSITSKQIKHTIRHIKLMLAKQTYLYYLPSNFQQSRLATSTDISNCINQVTKLIRSKPSIEERYHSLVDNWNPAMDDTAATLDLVYLLWTQRNMPKLKNTDARNAMLNFDARACREHPYIIVNNKGQVCINSGMKITKLVSQTKILNSAKLLKKAKVSKMRGKSIMNRNLFYSNLKLVKLSEMKKND